MIVQRKIEQIINQSKVSDIILSGYNQKIYIRNTFNSENHDWNIAGSISNEEIVEFLLGHTTHDIVRDEDSYDFSFSLNGKRLRANYYKSLGCPKIAIRVLMDEIPEFLSIFSPNIFELLFNLEKGLTIVVGKTTSGKTTAVFSALNQINNQFLKHIITIENPIEYILKENKSVISQREIGSDVKRFNIALSQCMRQSPDIIFVGEVRDSESADLSINLAETGHLVITTVHGGSIQEGIEKLLSYYPSSDMRKARVLLSGVFNGALYVKVAEGKIDYEYVFANDAVRSLIREGKVYQLTTEIERQNLWKK